jgi:acyl carrier protein
MVPAYFIRVEKIPLTFNGKVDKRALYSMGRRLGSGKAYVTPGNKTEELTASVWQEVLKVESVGIHDNFFDIGGNSLNIVQVYNKLKESLGLDIDVTMMFQYPTIHLLSGYLSREKAKGKGPWMEEEKKENEMLIEVEDTMRETVELFEYI